MNKKPGIIGGQLLIVLNIFVLFLLLFSKYIVLPFWMQPLGRMHPLLLHFPIVVLILGVVMGLRRFYIQQEANASFERFTRSLLLAGALLAGVTAIMGLFLSREGGYAGDTLVWHKWTGVAIFFISSVMYWAGYKPWYKRGMAWAFGSMLTIIMVVTGHYGSVLSHGEDFIIQPILAHIEKPLVPVEKAIVFNDLIKPIFDKKCASCHNLHKQKGELSLADSLSILKGGKTGKLFVAGYPEISLLLQRLHLPVDDEKHMPPTGKPQPDADEINMLVYWIKNQAGFTQKVTALPANDSLRVLANKFLKGSAAVEETFDFPAANEKAVAKLNTDYRTIQHFAKTSPALEVRIGNKDNYTVKQLEELGEIKKQVISLSLAKLPVKNEDLQKVILFDNLRRLDINFTDVTTAGLGALSSLKYLHTLCLSGTKISYKGFKEIIGTLKSLKTVTVWNTSLSAVEITQLQQAFKNITFIAGFSIDEKAQLTLNPPQVKNSSLVFANSCEVALRHPINGTEIRYTMDGKEPDSISSPVFNNTTVISKSTTIKAKAYKKGWYSSNVMVFDFFKNSFIPDSVAILSKLNSVHQAEGPQTFFNTRLGVIGANNPAWANYWAGVRNDDLITVFFFNKPVTVTSFGMHYMEEEASGIYPPGSVEVWGGDSPQKLSLLTKLSTSLPVKGAKPSLKLLEGIFKSRKLSCIKIVAKPFINKGKDRHLLLLDEMFLN